MITRRQRGVDTEAEWSTPKAARPVWPSARRSPIQSNTGSLDPKSSKPSQFSVIRRFIGIGPHASESYYHSYTVATSGVNRLASQICHNRLFRKKLQQNILPIISTEVSSLAAHNIRTFARWEALSFSRRTHRGCVFANVIQVIWCNAMQSAEHVVIRDAAAVVLPYVLGLRESTFMSLPAENNTPTAAKMTVR
jgi:hypothetical protein